MLNLPYSNYIKPYDRDNILALSYHERLILYKAEMAKRKELI